MLALITFKDNSDTHITELDRIRSEIILEGHWKREEYPRKCRLGGIEARACNEKNISVCG